MNLRDDDSAIVELTQSTRNAHCRRIVCHMSPENWKRTRACPIRSIPVFDADNHLYETEEALTRYLPDAYRRVID